ncbi:hypothetical protein D3C71_2202930 [compost metagenome]
MRVGPLVVGDAVAVGEAILEALLGIVPGTAARRHRDGDEQPGDDDAHEHGAQRREGIGLAGNPEDDEINHDG